MLIAMTNIDPNLKIEIQNAAMQAQIKFEDNHHKPSEGLVALIIHCGPDAELAYKRLRKEHSRISQLMLMKVNQQYERNRIAKLTMSNVRR